MKPQVYPETRGSHLAGQLERERALKRLGMAKSRKQREIEKRQRKARSKRRRAQLRIAESKQEDGKMMQQEMRVMSRAGSRRGQPMSKKETEQLNLVCLKYKRSSVIDWMLDHFYTDRKTVRPRKAAESLLSRAMGGDRISAKVSRMFRACIAEHPIDQQKRPGFDIVSQGTPDRGDNVSRQIDDALTTRVPALIASAIAEAFAKYALPAKPAAEVVPLRQPRELLVEVVQAASVDDGLYKQRWKYLCSTFELENGYDFDSMAKALNIDRTKSGWRLDVAEADGIIDALLVMARKLFGASVARNKS